MSFLKYIKKIYRYSVSRVQYNAFQKPRIIKYKLLSTCESIHGKVHLNQPAQINGEGAVIFQKSVCLGVNSSPYLYSGYIYIDAKNKKSTIEFGENVRINNNCSFISEGEGIVIGPNTLIGYSCEIIDTDFHDLNPRSRITGKALTSKVIVEDNVFIGSNVKILKGVRIGRNSVVANGSLVSKSIPANSIAAGLPAKVIRHL